MKRKVSIGICLLYILLSTGLTVYLFMNDQLNLALIGLSAIALGLLPIAIIKFTKFELSLAIIIFYILFLFGSQTLGSIFNFYEIGWWDVFMHLVSGVLLAYFGVDLYKKLLRKDTVSQLSPWFVFLFILSFSIFGGVIWEVYEFTMDQLFDMELQKGNTDTMTDLIADSSGGLVVALITAVRTKRLMKSKSTK